MDLKTSLAELVTHHPELARELDRRGLDYCCGGNDTLQAACTRRGLDPATVLSELAALAGEPTTTEWATLPLDDLLDHLEGTHHRYLWEELPRLSVLLAKVLDVHGRRHPELTAIVRCFEELRADLEPHLRKEEQVLFPLLRQLSRGGRPCTVHRNVVGHPVTMMLHEHDTLGAAFSRLRSLTRGFHPPQDACASYEAAFTRLQRLEADTHLHVHKENQRLFPLALELEERLLALR